MSRKWETTYIYIYIYIMMFFKFFEITDIYPYIYICSMLSLIHVDIPCYDKYILHVVARRSGCHQLYCKQLLDFTVPTNQ